MENTCKWRGKIFKTDKPERNFCADRSCRGKHMIEVRRKKQPKEAKVKAPAPTVLSQADPPAKSRERWVKIRIPRLNDDDNNYVLVGVNGKAYQIMREVDVAVPMSVYRVLQQAIEDRYTHREVRNAVGEPMIILEKREQPRFPVHVLGEEVRSS